LNFLSADVRNLFGPFINVFLVTGRHWTQTEVGLVTTASGLLGIALQTPIGAAIDVTRGKREVIVATMAAMSVAALFIVIRSTFWPMVFATSIWAIAGDAFALAVAALTSAAVLSISAGAIDHDRARDLGKEGDHGAAAAEYFALFRNPSLVVFAECAFFFHFANAPLLPLVRQKLALQFPREATAMMSFCMVAAQAVMVPIALLVGWRADRWGRRKIFLVAFSVLPVRAALYPVSDN